MTLIIETPPNLISERSYIFSVLLGDFLGLSWKHEVSERKDIKIYSLDDPEELILPDVFFSMSESNWLKKSSLPSTP